MPVEDEVHAAGRIELDGREALLVHEALDVFPAFPGSAFAGQKRAIEFRSAAHRTHDRRERHFDDAPVDDPRQIQSPANLLERQEVDGPAAGQRVEIGDDAAAAGGLEGTHPLTSCST
jgi:hypothetical protein